LIYTGSKALQYLSVPVYTIFKNMAIIVTAYAEMLWFGGSSVSRMTLFSFGLMVLSSIVAAWADIQHALTASDSTTAAHSSISTLNAGYTWMAINCFCAAAFTLSLRKKIKVLGFKDLDSRFSACTHFQISQLTDHSLSHVLQQSPPYSCPSRRFSIPRRLVGSQSGQELPTGTTLHHHFSHDILWHVCRLHFVHPRMVPACWHIYHIQHGGRFEQAPTLYCWTCFLRCSCYLRECERYYLRLCQWYRLYVSKAATGCEGQDVSANCGPRREGLSANLVSR